MGLGTFHLVIIYLKKDLGKLHKDLIHFRLCFARIKFNLHFENKTNRPSMSASSVANYNARSLFTIESSMHAYTCCWMLIHQLLGAFNM